MVLDCIMKRYGYVSKCLKDKCQYYEEFDCEKISTNGELD